LFHVKRRRDLRRKTASPADVIGRQTEKLIAEANTLFFLTRKLSYVSYDVCRPHSESLMALLLIPCPHTLLPIETGIDTDQRSLEAIRALSLKAYCRHCQEMHELPLTKATMAGEAPKPFRAQSN
jgi:hypothetical protein